MEFRLLGPLEVTEHGYTLALGGGKQRALLAVLLLHANDVVSTERLIDELWGDSPPATVAKSIQAYVSRLRKQLGADRLLTRSPGYVLRVDPSQFDVACFDRLVAEAASVDPRTAARKLRAALGLWRGPALADLAYEPFARAEIARLEEVRLAALEQRIDADLALGRHAELVGELEALVTEQPLRERLRSQLMLCLYRSGRQAEALGTYQAARRALVDELGIEPSRKLRELHQAILQQDPRLDLAVGAPEPAVETPTGAFVGRDAELAELISGLHDARAGAGRLFLLVGEPGIGKSRLADEVIRHARTLGARVLVGRCWEAGGAPAYWPWVQSLRGYVEQSDPEALRTQLAAGATDLAQIVPELRELFPDLPAPTLEAEGARFRLFDAAARFLRNAATAHPLVIVLDDLHAADEPSLLLLRFLAGELRGSRILLVGSYRDVDPTVRDPLAATLAELAREPVTHRIDLVGLTEGDVARYIELTARTTAPPQLTAAIHAETQGNPLFLGEVVRLLAAEGRLAEVDVSALWSLGIPQGVREVIGRRVRRLSDDCGGMLTLASVLGREFGLDALEQLTKLSDEELLEVLDEAVAARVLTALPGAPGRLRFAHALIRETLYDQLTAPRRVQLHRRAADALEELYAPDPEPHLAELAHHFFEAAPGGDLDKALGYARRAGERAVGLLAYEEGARYYELALQALELKQPIDARARCELLLELGEALAKAGTMLEAKERFLAAAELARSSGRSQHLARAALGYGGRYRFARAGPDRSIVPLLEEALAALGEQQSVLRVRLLARLASALRDQPSLEPRSSLSRQAVDIARRLGDKATLADALVSQFTATWSPEAERLLAIAQEVGRLADDTGDAERAFQARFLDHIASLTLGEPERVASIMDEHRALANVLKQPTLQWWSLVMRSVWALLRGQFNDGEQLAEEALRVGQRAQSWDAGFSYRIALFVLRREQGRLNEVEKLIRESTDEYAGYRSFRCLVPLIECELGREHEARRRFDELAADQFSALPPDGEWLFCLSLLSEVAAQLHDRERAAHLYRMLLPYGHLNALAAGEVAVGSVSRYLGLLASTTRQWNDAARHYEDALKMNARLGARPWLAHTERDYARMLLARGSTGDRDRAQSLLSQASASYEELGMPTGAASASALALHAGFIAP
jgi:DNA-binding SARP family transcriptional activator